MLGHQLIRSWQKRFDVWTTIRGKFSQFESYGFYQKEQTFDLVEAEKIGTVAKIVGEIRPQVIFNAVGIVKQVPTAKNIIRMLMINSIFPHQLAEIAGKYNIRLINISTDCVFDGKKGSYTEEDLPNATDLYGKSKNLGEVIQKNCLTIRTSIIGRELRSSHSLVEWFLSNRGRSVKGFRRAIYSGFPTCVLADIIGDLIEKFPDLDGLYHLSSEPINKYELLKIIKEEFGVGVEIEPYDDFVIDRSLDSTKFRRLTGFQPLDWRTMVRQMARDWKLYEDWRESDKRRTEK